MRIGAIWDRQNVNGLYRVVVPMRALEARGVEVLWDALHDGRFDYACLTACDVLLIHRYVDLGMRRLVARLKRDGVPIWWDNDDAVDLLPPSEMASKDVRRRMARIAGELRQMLELADLVTAPSSALVKRLDAMGARRVRLIENHVPSSFVATRKRPPRAPKVVVGWTAGVEHRQDLAALDLRSVLSRLARAQPDVEIRSIGLDLRLPEAYARVPRVPFDDLAHAVSGFDVGIAPLADVPFNRHRSNVKLKEYGAAGVPWLASPVGPYRGHGRDEGGRLVDDDEWYAALDELVRDARARRKLAKRAQRWAQRQTVDRHWKEWLAAAEEARAIARAAA